MNIERPLPKLLASAVFIVLVGVIVAAFVKDHAPAPVGGTREMLRVPAGSFDMGFEHGYDDERPLHQVQIREFRIDRTEVSNHQFRRFVEATGHLTQAERDGYCWAYVEHADDFQALQGASWRYPQGPGSSIDDRLDHPVVCVSWEDASAYAAWADKRLPTEAEWEYVARAGGLGHYRAADVRFESAPSGSAPHATDHHQGLGVSTTGAPEPSAKSHLQARGPAAGRPGEETVVGNVWQGQWPDTNHLSDGYYYTAPVGRFDPNPWGVHDTLGNVWEWTSDWYQADYYEHSPLSNPSGPTAGSNRVARGGSWFCSPNYCGAYSTHYRGSSPPDHAFNNVGFRCASDLADSDAEVSAAAERQTVVRAVSTIN